MRSAVAKRTPIPIKEGRFIGEGLTESIPPRATAASDFDPKEIEWLRSAVERALFKPIECADTPPLTAEAFEKMTAAALAALADPPRYRVAPELSAAYFFEDLQLLMVPDDQQWLDELARLGVSKISEKELERRSRRQIEKQISGMRLKWEE